MPRLLAACRRTDVFFGRNLSYRNPISSPGYDRLSSTRCRPCRGCASSANRADTINPPARNLELPIACALDEAQFAERKRLVERLAEQATERQALPNGVRLRFEAIAGRATELAKFVDMERSCCPFLTFRIDANPGDCISLELTGPIPAQEIIRELIPEIVR